MKTKPFLAILISFLVLSACQENEKTALPDDMAIEASRVDGLNIDNLIVGKSYLPLYSHIYHVHKQKLHNLAVTVSIRNISQTDTIYLLKADYYNTQGDLIREYIENPIFLTPLETIEIVIDEDDTEGGSGANFIFDWAIEDERNLPLFEAIMISTYGQQGLSFTSKGIRIYE